MNNNNSNQKLNNNTYQCECKYWKEDYVNRAYSDCNTIMCMWG